MFEYTIGILLMVFYGAWFFAIGFKCGKNKGIDETIKNMRAEETDEEHTAEE